MDRVVAFIELRLIAAAALFALSATALDNGLARTPQMGWNNWNALACNVSEDLLLQTAKLIVNYGLKDLGYQYVVLDDCWSAGRNASNNNSLLADLKKFPRGMAAVADDMHALGLKYGMYSDAGSKSCARYRAMSEALNATGRPILYSICNWGEDQPWDWAASMANSWRISGDIWDSFDGDNGTCPCDGPSAWNCTNTGINCSVTNIMNKASFITAKGQPGGWNDLDMLEVGNGNMTDSEYVAHFSIWSVIKSALLMGNDIRKIAPADLAILSNPAVIAVNQDPLGSSASRRWMRDNIQMCCPPRQRQQRFSVMNATLADILADYTPNAPELKLAWEVRDLWANRMSNDMASAIIAGNNSTEGRYNSTETSYADGLAQGNPLLVGNVTTTVQPSGTITATVGRHGAAMFRLRALTTTTC
ncbi:uncharacterized protein BP5553_07294 [Venustampulla echinocandica]|uniref:Alpha-galactosidase n=1 Tax=Venustampulla echinocandica TaxID=2656787 RepID=A0A370TJ30_9HELO|nr:uncharacterized protein BP5553_07294 [Venustampulla echinocandica]RDL35363.1 hypothetical protein BP5553_07294 [Venustampulla echinocandica]